MKPNKLYSNYTNIITKRIAAQYLITLAIFALAVFSVPFFSYRLLKSKTWQPDDKLYLFFKFIESITPFILAVMLIAGFGYITYHFMAKPLSYLDEIISASKKLMSSNKEQIILSDTMKSVQDEMNMVRQASLHNEQLAKEAEQRKNDLIVYLAHDLKTPLTSVMGYLTLLTDEKEISKELREKYLSISLNKAQQLEDLINEFFEITRFNLSNIPLQFSTVNLERFLQQLTFEFQPMIMEKDLQCKLFVPKDIAIKCDANKMQRVFDNILRNAIFYSFDGGTIEISVEQQEKLTKIRFANQGSNIPKEKLDRIFEQFYRLDSARSTNNSGAGLGLAIAKEIVELHGGTIRAVCDQELIEIFVEIPSL